MKSNKKVTNRKFFKIFGASFLLLLIVGGGILLVNHLLSSMCNFTYGEKIFSPKRGYFLQKIESNCGATVRLQTDVMLYKTDSEDSANPEKQDIFGFIGYPSSINVSWMDNNSIKIQHNENCNEVLLRKTSWKDMKIVYEGSCSENN